MTRFDDSDASPCHCFWCGELTCYMLMCVDTEYPCCREHEQDLVAYLRRCGKVVVE